MRTRVHRVWTRCRLGGVREGSEEQSVQDLESDVSGSYFPPPVRAVEIPKPHGGGTRTLGVPTVAEQNRPDGGNAGVLERGAEPVFHPDSHGYRPRGWRSTRSQPCRRRCWRHDWVIDLDIRKFFDSVPWDLMLKAVAAPHRPAVGAVVCAPLVGRTAATTRRHPATTRPRNSTGVRGLTRSWRTCSSTTRSMRGWPGRSRPSRSNATLDDVVVHCVSERQARYVLAEIGERMRAGRAEPAPGEDPDRVLPGRRRRGRRRARRVQLPRLWIPGTLRADQGRAIVPCRFCPRSVKTGAEQGQRRGGSGGSPPRAPPDPRRISPERSTRSCRVGCNYSGPFLWSALSPLLEHINARLIGGSARNISDRGQKKARTAWNRAVKERPRYFAHGPGPATPAQSGDRNDESRMNPEVHVRICESRGVKLPRLLRRI